MPFRLCIKGILPALSLSCGKCIAFAFKERSYFPEGLFKIHFCSWGCSKHVAWERRKQGHLSLSCSDMSNVDNIVYSKTASLKQGRVHWRFSMFLREWQTCHSKKKEFRATQVCYQRLLLLIETVANMSHWSQKVLAKGLSLSYLRLCSWSAGDSGKCVATL